MDVLFTLSTAAHAAPYVFLRFLVRILNKAIFPYIIVVSWF